MFKTKKSIEKIHVCYAISRRLHAKGYQYLYSCLSAFGISWYLHNYINNKYSWECLWIIMLTFSTFPRWESVTGRKLIRMLGCSDECLCRSSNNCWQIRKDPLKDTCHWQEMLPLCPAKDSLEAFGFTLIHGSWRLDACAFTHRSIEEICGKLRPQSAIPYTM